MNVNTTLTIGNRNTKCMIHRGQPVKCIETGIVYPSVREEGRRTKIDDSSISKVCRRRRLYSRWL